MDCPNLQVYKLEGTTKPHTLKLGFHNIEIHGIFCKWLFHPMKTPHAWFLDVVIRVHLFYRN